MCLNNIDTQDPAGFIVSRQLLTQVFTIDKEVTYLQNEEDRVFLRRRIESLCQNLSSNDINMSLFKEGLMNGDFEFILDRFNSLQESINKSLSRFPSRNVIINNEIKPANIGAVYCAQNNIWEVTQSFDFDNIAFGQSKNGDSTPIEKDLGRTISFFAFDKDSGEFYADYAHKVIEGFLQKLNRPLNFEEVQRLEEYIQLGLVTSYLWRSSYFAEQLQGIALRS